MIRLKELREEIGYSQTQVANAIKTNQRNIGRWENGENEPTSSFIVKLADFFNVSADFILGREDDLGNVKIPDVSPVLSNDENDLLHFYRAISDVEKRAIFDTAKAFYSNHSKGKITV